MIIGDYNVSTACVIICPKDTLASTELSCIIFS